MNRAELVSYINNSIMLGNVVTENSEIYKSFVKDAADYYSGMEGRLLGCVCIDNTFYVKKDDNGRIHLTFFDGGYEDLDLGDCIDIIDEYAFAWEEKLKTIVGKSVIEIKYDAFYRSSIEEINFPNVVEIGEGSFELTPLKKVVLNSIKEVPIYAFAKTSLESFRGDKVGVVEDWAFKDCNKLKEIYLPTAEMLAPSCFSNCRALNKAHVPDTCINQRYALTLAKW